MWPELESQVELSVQTSNGRSTTQTVYENAVKGDDQVWVLSTHDRVLATIVTSISQYPEKRLLHISWAGGRDVLDNVDTIWFSLVEFAIENYCDGIEVPGRKGWERVFERFNGKLAYQVYEVMFD